MRKNIAASDMSYNELKRLPKEPWIKYSKNVYIVRIKKKNEAIKTF